MTENIRSQYDLVGRSVDIVFVSHSMDEAHDRRVLAIEGGMLICQAPDDVIEWFPMTGILRISEHQAKLQAEGIRSYWMAGQNQNPAGPSGTG